MSIAVPLTELAERLPSWGAAAVITSSPTGARVVTLNPRVVEESGDRPAVLRFEQPGRSALANAAAQPSVTLYFAPHAGSEGYSLIVDGDGSVEGDDLIVMPTSAVLHRPAPA